MGTGPKTGTPGEAAARSPGDGAGADLRRGALVGGRFRLRALVSLDARGSAWRATDEAAGGDEARVVLRTDGLDADRAAAWAAFAGGSSVVPRPLAVGALDGRTTFVATEAPRGTRLDVRLRTGAPQAPREALEPLARLLEELARAHAAGLAGLPCRPDQVHVAELGFGLLLVVPELGLGAAGEDALADDLRGATWLACTLLLGREVADERAARAALAGAWLAPPLRRLLEELVEESAAPLPLERLRARLSALADRLLEPSPHGPGSRSLAAGLFVAASLVGAWFVTSPGWGRVAAAPGAASLEAPELEPGPRAAPGAAGEGASGAVPPDALPPGEELRAARTRATEAEDEARRAREELERGALAHEAEERLADEEHERLEGLFQEATSHVHALEDELAATRAERDGAQARAAEAAGEAQRSAELGSQVLELGRRAQAAEDEAEGLRGTLAAESARREEAEGELERATQAGRELAARVEDAERGRDEADARAAESAREAERLARELASERELRAGAEADLLHERSRAEAAEEALAEAGSQRRAEAEAAAERLQAAETDRTADRERIGALEQALREAEAVRARTEDDLRAERAARASAENTLARSEEARDAAAAASAELERRLGALRRERERRLLAEVARGAGAGRALAAWQAARAAARTLGEVQDGPARLEPAFDGRRALRAFDLEAGALGEPARAALEQELRPARAALDAEAAAWRARLAGRWSEVEAAPPAAEPARALALGLWFEDGRLERRLGLLADELSARALDGGRWDLARLEAPEVRDWAELLLGDPLAEGAGRLLVELDLRRRASRDPGALLGVPGSEHTFLRADEGGTSSVQAVVVVREAGAVRWVERGSAAAGPELALAVEGGRLRLRDEAGPLAELDLRAADAASAPAEGPVTLRGESGLELDARGLRAYRGRDGVLRVRADGGR